jgi:cyclopropane-fatty-acyl-phospholipid synthase
MTCAKISYSDKCLSQKAGAKKTKVQMRWIWCLYVAASLFVPTCAWSDEPISQPSSNPKNIVVEALALADIQVNGNRPWDIIVKNEDFYERVLSQGSLGLGESYMDGWWETKAVDQFIDRVLSARLDNRIKLNWQMIYAYLKSLLTNLQDKKGSMKVIDHHYQLGNDLYAVMLDPTMTYSCGYWKNASDLTEAQNAKYDLICRKLALKPNMSVLDIGCGWGGFAKYAAEKYQVHVTGITLSKNQAEYAQKLCAGLPVEIRLQDYRDVDEQFDRVLEIGMFEHVGAKNYRAFMEVVHKVLKPDGLFMLHTIGGNKSTTTADPWITKYIFPNGQIPSIGQIGTSIESLFVMEDWHNFGPDYDKTLMAWFSNFDANWPKLSEKYGDRFYRMWKYYLLSCAGAFRARDIQLWQVLLSKKGIPGGHETVR